MLGKVATFGGYSLNGFEAIIFFWWGEPQKPPDLLYNKNEFQTFKTPTATAPNLEPRPLPKQ